MHKKKFFLVLALLSVQLYGSQNSPITQSNPKQVERAYSRALWNGFQSGAGATLATTVGALYFLEGFKDCEWCGTLLFGITGGFGLNGALPHSQDYLYSEKKAFDDKEKRQIVAFELLLSLLSKEEREKTGTKKRRDFAQKLAEARRNQPILDNQQRTELKNKYNRGYRVGALSPLVTAFVYYTSTLLVGEFPSA